MDADDDTECLFFTTPSITSQLSESNASDYFDLDCSFSSKEYQQQMSNLTKDLQKVIDFCCQSDGHKSQAELQDQQPIEAIDDSQEPSNIQTTTTNCTIDRSLHSHVSKEHDDDNFTIVPETNAHEDNFSTIMSDDETISETEPFTKPVLNYSRSLCIPYTDNANDTPVIEETFTPISNQSLKFIGTEKSDKNNIGYILISCNHSTKSTCLRIAKKLQELNYDVRLSQDNISGDVFTSMATAVENCFVVLMAINESYYQSRYCRLEAEYSVECNKISIPMMMQAGYKPSGWLGIINGSKLQIDFSTLSFDEALSLLIREIDAVRISLGADGNSSNIMISNRNPSATTINNSWFDFQNIQDWTAGDVIDWLNREKLEFFEDALRNFDGKTLCQLHKIKLNSPPEFYRMLESLLPSTVPHRLFHNLTFDAALESLFSSTTYTPHG